MAEEAERVGLAGRAEDERGEGEPDPEPERESELGEPKGHEQAWRQACRQP